MMPCNHSRFVSVLSLWRVTLATNTVYAAGVADDWPPKPIHIDSGVSGHIHPAACLTKKGTVLVAYCRSDYKDMRLVRSADGGRTWSDPVAFAPTAKLSIYPRFVDHARGRPHPSCL